MSTSGADLTVLLLGSGGREHALAWKLAQSPRLKNLYAMPGSDAISEWAQCLPGDPADPDAVAFAAKKAHAKLVFVGPEAPLAAGAADACRAAGVAVFGPGKDAARLESSKAFAKDFLKRHGIPTADYEVFDDAKKARGAAVLWPPPIVVKADGLAAGKGVRVCATAGEALKAVDDFMSAKALGAAGSRIVLERCLIGPELTVMALCDGKSYRLLPPSRDHKRLKDGDQGPNTGGMGVIAPAPVDTALMTRIRAEVLRRVLDGMKEDGLDFRGLLYVGLMLTPDGPKVLEFNARFGDPETQAVLPLLEADLLDAAWACANGELGQGSLACRPGACVAVTLASEGYPEKPVAGRRIKGLDILPEGALVFHAGTVHRDGTWTTAGGRVLTLVGRGQDLPAARKAAYAAAGAVRFEGMQLRRDIGAEEPALR